MENPNSLRKRNQNGGFNVDFPMAMSVCWKVTNFKQQLQMHMKHQTKQKQFQVKLF